MSTIGLKTRPDGSIEVGFSPGIAILRPYVWARFREQIVACLPISGYLVLFQIAVLQKPVEGALIIGFGIFLVLLGLMFFMEGRFSG